MPDGRTVIAGSRAAALAARGAAPARRRRASRRILDTTPRAQLAARAAAPARLPAVALFRQGAGAAARGAGARCRSSRRRPSSRPSARTGSREVVFGAGGGGAAHRGRSAAAAPGRGAERQSRHRRRRRASLGRRAALLGRRCSTRIRQQLGAGHRRSRATAPASRARTAAAERGPHRGASRPCDALGARARRAAPIAQTSGQTLRARQSAAAPSSTRSTGRRRSSACPRATRIVCRCEEVTAEADARHGRARLRRARTR